MNFVTTVLPLVNRRIRICKHAPICPKCRSNQIQLVDAKLLAKWKCRVCKYKWTHEPLFKE